jgi:hypothetical protein
VRFGFGGGVLGFEVWGLGFGVIISMGVQQIASRDCMGIQYSTVVVEREYPIE